MLLSQVRCMVAVLQLIGQGQEQPAVVSRLLDIAATPCKPVYTPASEARPDPGLCLLSTDTNLLKLPVKGKSLKISVEKICILKFSWLLVGTQRRVHDKATFAASMICLVLPVGAAAPVRLQLPGPGLESAATGARGDAATLSGDRGRSPRAGVCSAHRLHAPHFRPGLFTL